jgi:hypothetical protein
VRGNVPRVALKVALLLMAGAAGVVLLGVAAVFVQAAVRPAHRSVEYAPTGGIA